MNHHIRPIVLGEYSPSQNGIIVSPLGIAQCIAGGGQWTRYNETENTDRVCVNEKPLWCTSARKKQKPSVGSMEIGGAGMQTNITK